MAQAGFGNFAGQQKELDVPEKMFAAIVENPALQMPPFRRLQASFSYIILRGMRSPGFVLAIVSLLAALPVCGQNETRETAPAEAKALTAIEELMSKSRQGGDKPTDQD